MKTFVAIYTGSLEAKTQWDSLDAATRKEKEQAGMKAWMQWGKEHAKAIKDNGAPLGKTKRVTLKGIADTKNQMAAYAIVQAESHEEAAKIFLNHPHFSIFPGDGVEIMECLPMPKR